MGHDNLTPTGEWASLVDIVSWRSQHQADRRAYTFLLDGETQETYLSYGELDRQARAIAAQLQEWEARGERALLLYPPGLAYVAAFFGCLYAGVLAVPLYPPRSRGTDERIQRISQDAQASFALTTGKIADKMQQTLSESPPLEKLHWVATDQLALENASLWQMPDLTNTSLAYLQYTSGSTSLPKGVMVSHGNLLYNMALIAKGLVHGPADL